MKKLLLTVFLCIGMFAAFSFLESSKAFAAECTWNGSVNDIWSNPDNWNPGCSGTEGIPGNGDDLIFPLSPFTYFMNNDIDGLSLNSLTFHADDNENYMLSGNEINISNGINITRIGGTVILNLDLNLTQSQTFNLAGSFINGNIILNGDLTVASIIDNSVFNGVISGNGEIIVDSYYIIYFAGDNTFNGNITVKSTSKMGISSNAGFGNPDNLITFEEGALLFMDSGNVTSPNDIHFNGNNILVSLGNNELSGDINLGESTWIYTYNGMYTFSGVLSNGDLSIDGGGALILSGTSSNTFNGNTNIYNGTLVLEKTNGSTAINGNIVVGDSTYVAVLTQSESNNIADTSDIIINELGEWYLDGNDETIDTLTLNLGVVNANGGDLTASYIEMTGGGMDSGSSGGIRLNGGMSINNSSVAAYIRGHLYLLASTTTIYGDNFDEQVDLEIPASIHSSNNIIFDGGVTILSGNNNYTGNTTIQGGALLYTTTPNAFGTADGSTAINDVSSVILSVNSFTDYIYEPFIIDSTGYGDFDPISAESSLVLRGDITLATDTSFGVINSPDTLSVWGIISGNHSLTFNNLDSSADEVHFYIENTNTFNGTVIINPNVYLRVAGVNTLSNNHVVISASSTMHIGQSGLGDGINTIIGSISGDGTLLIASGGDVGSMTIGRDEDSLITFNGHITGDGQIFKTGTNTWNHTGTNSHTGLITINEGTLLLNGTDDYSDISLSGNGTLGGNATVLSITGYSGNIAPGNSPGITNVIGDMSLTSAMTTEIEIDGTTPGTGYDQIIVDGDVFLGDSQLNVVMGFTPSVGDTFVIIETENGGTINGTFNNLANDAVFNSGSQYFRINYTATSVTLTALVTPPQLGNTGINIPVAQISFGTIIFGLMTIGYNVKRKNLFKTQSK